MVKLNWFIDICVRDKNTSTSTMLFSTVFKESEK